MHISSISTAVTLFAASVAAQTLNKPPLQPNLDNLRQGLMNNLAPTANTRTRFREGYMPQDCKTIAQNEGFKPADFNIWNIKYNDCSTPWIMCYHKNSNGPLDDLVNRFGRLPVHTRQYVRHVITLPSANAYAYNSGGNIAFFGTTLSDLNVHVHESAHSLDLLNAYPDKPLSSSQRWQRAYNQDSAVPDPYAQTNQVENVAQNTVVATFDRNVPGGFPGKNPNANRIHNQYTTVVDEQREAGKLLIPGGQCTSRLQNSPAVPVGPGSTEAAEVEAAGGAPDVSLPAGLAVVAPKEFNTNGTCYFG